METIKRYAVNPIVTAVLGLLVGLFLGLVILGWWLFPVRWENASQADLRADAKVTYLRTCIDAYGYNGDSARAKACYESLGEGKDLALQEVVGNPNIQNPQLVTAFANLALEGAAVTPAEVQSVMEQPAEGEPATQETPAAGDTAFTLPEQESEQPAEAGRPAWMNLLCYGGLLVVAMALLAVLLYRLGILKPGVIKMPSIGGKGAPADVDYESEDVPPISRNVAAYQVGNDLFDEVYSIEADGEFLGEYGVAIADATGVGGPKKVSAFEVWLFDKKNIPTTTKVLMSEQSFADPTRRQKLEAKGETVLADPEHPVVLQTDTLRLVARLIDMNYAQGAAGAYFERFVLELKVWQIGE